MNVYMCDMYLLQQLLSVKVINAVRIFRAREQIFSNYVQCKNDAIFDDLTEIARHIFCHPNFVNKRFFFVFVFKMIHRIWQTSVRRHQIARLNARLHIYAFSCFCH